MYRALVEVRALAAKHKLRAYRNIEACWVGTAIDLKDGDLTMDAGAAREATVLAHIRAVGRRPTAGAIVASDVRRFATGMTSEAAAFHGTAFERMLCSVGAAMALAAGKAQGVTVAYMGRDELTGLEWKRVFALVAQDSLPLILVALPGASSSKDLGTLAKGAGVPVIPVDAGDAVALYRVAQETIVRARADGGAAVIEAVACGTDAVSLLGSQLVAKGICTQRWIDAVEATTNSLAPA